MVEKTFICTNDEKLLNPLKSIFKNIDLIEILEMKAFDFWRYPKIDIGQMPTTLAEQFGSKPFDLDCQILNTNRKYGLPELIVTNPNFGNHMKMNNHFKGIYQIEVPLKKVIEFAKINNRNLNYGVLTEFAFAYFEKEKINFEEIRNIFLRNLQNQIV